MKKIKSSMEPEKKSPAGGVNSNTYVDIGIVTGCLTVCVLSILALSWLAYTQVVLPWVFDRHYTMGERHYRNEKYQEALTYLDQAIQDDPSRPNAHYYRGVARGILGDTGGAVADLNRAIDLGLDEMKTSWAYYNLGISMARLNRFSSAVHYYTKAIDAYPEYIPGEFYYNRGVAHLNLGNMKNAEDDGRMALGSFSGWHRSHFVCSVRSRYRSKKFCINVLPFGGSGNPSQRYIRSCVSHTPNAEGIADMPTDSVLDLLESGIDCSR